VSEQQLALAPAEPTVELELVDGTIADELADAVVIAPSAPPPTELEQRNLFGEAERIAARAASASTRRQYASIFRAFGDWLSGELGRPPLVADLDKDAIAAYARHLATAGGRGRRPAAPATTRAYPSRSERSPVISAARTRSRGCASRGTSRARPRRSPTPTTRTCSVSPIAARSPANATAAGARRLRASLRGAPRPPRA
jgi:hypothetical protein